MAETLVKNEVCKKCGVDVRANTQFCYNCGASVSGSVENDLTDGNKETNLLVFPENAVAEKDSAAVRDHLAEAATGNGNAAVEEKPPLKSAASMRRKPKTIQRKRVEISWQEPESAPNLWFILAAVLLTVFAFVLWFLASSLK